MVEILIYAAMQAGNNVLVDGSLRNWEWYVKYFARLKEEYSCAKISILHVDAPREAIIQRAKVSAIISYPANGLRTRCLRFKPVLHF